MIIKEIKIAEEIKREQQGNNLLILEKLEFPRKLWSKGKTMHYALYYRWLKDNDPTRVQGQDVSYWTKKEGQEMIKNGLFNSVNLFP